MKTSAPVFPGKIPGEVSRQRRSSSKVQTFDAERMRLLAIFTARTRQTPYPTPFGSEVIESASGRMVTRRVNHSFQHTDPTQHAEVYALRSACQKVRSCSLQGHTLFTTCEPCPLCMAACLWSGLDRVVYGATIDDAAQYYPQIYLYAKDLARRGDMSCAVTGPVERDICLSLFKLTASKARRTPSNWRRQ